MEAIQIEQLGGPEVLHAAELPDPTPGPGEVLVRVAAAGLNFVDTYHRTGLYPHQLPFVPGQEGSGVIESDRPRRRRDDAAATVSPGPTATAPMPSSCRSPRPVRCACPMRWSWRRRQRRCSKGMTAHYLVNDTYPVQPGDRCALYAAAGGVGTLLTQMVRLEGGESFAVVGSDAKAEVAREAGAHHVIVAGDGDLLEQIESIAGKRQMAVVYDGVGAATFETSLRLLRKTGDAGRLRERQRAGSSHRHPHSLTQRLAVPDPTLTGRLHRRARRPGDGAPRTYSSGSAPVGSRSRWAPGYPLAEAAEAHRALEGRQTIGKVLLIAEYLVLSTWYLDRTLPYLPSSQVGQVGSFLEATWWKGGEVGLHRAFISSTLGPSCSLWRNREFIGWHAARVLF